MTTVHGIVLAALISLCTIILVFGQAAAQADNQSDAKSNETTTISPTTTSATTPTSTITPKNMTVPKNLECLNGGTYNVTASKCVCASDYYGERCEFAICKQDAFKNDSLAVQQCLNGYCLRDTTTNEYTCKCKPTHEGALCERPVCLNYCYNGGGCKDNLEAQPDFTLNQINDFKPNMTCLCPAGNRFYGSRCEFDRCIESVENCSNKCWVDNNCKCNCDSECDQTFCNKVGTCMLDLSKKLICKCSVGYSGIRCTRDDCIGYCFFNGTCNRNNETIYCNCAPGYNGTRCENKLFKGDELTPTPLPQKKSSSMKSLIYGLTITIIICLCLIGVYLVLQKGAFDHLNINILNRIRGYRTGNQGATSTSGSNGSSIVRTNLFFNKLEDEQNIIQNMS